ncbi:MAG: queuosine salvage family protein [Anaerolineae bacterium]
MNRLLVIGGASFDRLHLQDRTVESVGGVGMYTAMAAHRSGAQVAIFSIRPDPCPEWLQPVAGRLAEWLGPPVSPAQLPQFEISYHGGKTEYLNVSLGAIATLSPTMLPADLSRYDLVHVAQREDPAVQLSFIQACRQRGAGQISAGTYPADAVERPQGVRAVIAQSDYFFMNDLEAGAVFGSLEAARTEPGQVLTLAHLLQNQHPIMAARRAVALAGEMIGQVGPAALLSQEPPPEVPLDPRVQVNEGQVRRVAKIISTLPEAPPYPWVGPTLPPAGHPRALEYLFAATLQQFSFWTVREDRYHLPLIAPIGGIELKGSDYLWSAFTRALENDAGFCAPERQAALTREELLAVFRADDGRDPMPALDLHLDQARAYGRDMLALQLTPRAVLDRALASPQPLQTFLRTLDHVGGYKEDPLRKKSSLLALALHDRPERFLPLQDEERIAPIMSAVNGLLFGNARKRCPEMTEPQCQSCPFDPVCAHRKAFFQPVLRTSFY